MGKGQMKNRTNINDWFSRMTGKSYTIVRNARRRSLALTIQPGGEIRILAPSGISLYRINRLLHRHAGWIQKKLDTALSHESPWKPDFTDGASLPYRGREHRLVITGDPFLPSGCRLDENRIHVNVVGDSPPDEARLEIRLWYKKQARQELPDRLAYWSQRLDVTATRLIITNPSRRWGSCSVAGIIRLNWRLILTPPEVTDYVVAHELCHIRHKNHARVFWDCLGKIIPDYKARRLILREWEKRLAWF